MWKLISGQCQIHAAGAEDPSGRSDGAQSPADTPGSLSPGTHGWLSDPNLCRTGPGGERERENAPSLESDIRGNLRYSGGPRGGGGELIHGVQEEGEPRTV